MRINSFLFSASLCMALGLLAACARGPISDPLPSDIDPVELQKRIHRSVQLVGKYGTTLSLDPGYVGACKGWERGTSRISWKTDPAKVASVRVEVENRSTGTRQVFAAGGAAGEAIAEGWFAEGVTFHLINGASNAELVTYPVEALNCAQP